MRSAPKWFLVGLAALLMGCGESAPDVKSDSEAEAEKARAAGRVSDEDARALSEVPAPATPEDK